MKLKKLLSMVLMLSILLCSTNITELKATAETTATSATSTSAVTSAVTKATSTVTAATATATAPIAIATAATPNAVTSDQLVIYPEYPSEIGRDYDYSVRVKQGNSIYHSLPVYNNCPQANHFSISKYRGDMHRRFAEFAATGSAITVEVTVNMSFDSYSVLPSSKQLSSKQNGNVITFTVSESGQYLIRLNNDDDTLLAIFVDEPESNVPSVSDSKVVYYNVGTKLNEVLSSVEGATIYLAPGYHNAGKVRLLKNQTLYLAPGAVLNARILIAGKGVTVKGRGIIKEPNQDRNNNLWNYEYSAMICVFAPNFQMYDVKVLDARCYNIIFNGYASNSYFKDHYQYQSQYDSWEASDQANIDNIKVLSNQISTDGLQFYGKVHDITVSDCFFHISDNVYVIGSDSPNNIKIVNNVVGSDFVTVYPQGTVGKIDFSNLEVFRSRLIVENSYNSDTVNHYAAITIDGLDAIDCTNSPPLFYGLKHNAGVKSYTLKNIRVPYTASNQYVFKIKDGSEYQFELENVWIGSNMLTSTLFNSDAVKYNLYDKSAATLHFLGVSVGDKVFVPKNTNSAASYQHNYLYLGKYKLQTAEQIQTINSMKYVPLFAVAEKFGFKVSYDETSGAILLDDGLLNIKTSVGKNILSLNYVKKDFVNPIIKLANGTVMAPLKLFELSGFSVSDSGSVTIQPINHGQNLLLNSDIEKGLTYDWTTRWFTKLSTSQDAHGGNNSLMIPNTNKATSLTGTDNGVYQFIQNQLEQYGTGTYHLTFYAKAANPNEKPSIGVGLCTDYNSDNYATTATLNNSWQLVTTDLAVNTLPNSSYLNLKTCNGAVLIDDVALTYAGKVTTYPTYKVSFKNADGTSASGDINNIFAGGIISLPSNANGSTPVSGWKIGKTVLLPRAEYTVNENTSFVAVTSAVTPTHAPTSLPTLMPTPTPSPTTTPTPSRTPTPSPSLTQVPTPAPTPSSDPSLEPTPTPTSTATPSPNPSLAPTPTTTAPTSGSVKITKMDIHKNKTISATVNSVYKKTSNVDAIAVNLSSKDNFEKPETASILVSELSTIHEGTKVYVYRVNKKTKKLEQLPNSTQVVEQDKKINISIAVNGIYVILNRKPSNSNIVPIKNQVKVALRGTNTLSLSGTKSKALSVSLPNTIVMVDNLSKSLESNALLGVKISYSSTNKKVATVNANGKITAKRPGKAVIKVIFQFKNGPKTSKKIKINIKK